jgi:hypothetical protein
MDFTYMPEIFKYQQTFFVLPLLFILTGCGGYHPYVAPVPVPGDRYPVPPPVERSARNDFADAFDQQFVLQGEQFMDLSRHIRNLTGDPKQAYNADAFGEVPNSSWFTNRNAQRRMSIAEIVRGPDTGSGPDTASTWTIIRAKAEGVTPGFTIVDGRGDKYVIKFDPIGYAGLNSGAEVIGSKLFYAAGYNVPENYITYFHPRILRLGDQVKLRDEKGRKRFMTEDDLREMLDRVEYLPNSLIRATASKYIPGRPLGPFKFDSRRKDDPNDFISHKHRRELRGLRVMAAWLNHIDSKSANSMDTYIEEDGRGYVKHYLIDFGTILGSGGRGPQPKYRGHKNEIDPHAFLVHTFTFGLYVPGWERLPDEVEYPCIGRYTSDFYHPKRFKFIFPNPAYDNMTSLDGYWGAKQVTSFTDEQLKAVVDQAQYPDPEGAEYLLRILIERRDLTGRYWFNRVAPLDSFELLQSRDGRQTLQFIDLAVETGLEKDQEVNYQYSITRNGVEIVPPMNLGSRAQVPLPNLKRQNDVEISVAEADIQWEVTLRVQRGKGGKLSKWVKVYLGQAGGEYSLLGLKRQG